MPLRRASLTASDSTSPTPSLHVAELFQLIGEGAKASLWRYNQMLRADEARQHGSAAHLGERKTLISNLGQMRLVSTGVQLI